MTEPVRLPREGLGLARAIGEDRATMEAEHRVELALLDALEDAVKRDLGPNRVSEVLAQLIEHTTVHFISEQLLMRLAAYPGYEAHMLEHDHLLEHVQTLRDRVDGGSARATLASIESVRAGLTRHIDGQNRAFLKHLEEAGHSQ